MTFNKNARKLYFKFLPREGTLKDGNTEYYFFEGFKFEKKTFFDGRQIYRVYSTYYDHYQEIVQEALLDALLKKDHLEGIIYIFAKMNNERNYNKFLEQMKEFLND